MRDKELRYIEYKRSVGRRADGIEDDDIPLEAAQPLTAEEEALKEQLLSQGFGSWSKKDFNAFVRGCEVCLAVSDRVSPNASHIRALPSLLGPRLSLSCSGGTTFPM